MSVEEIIKQQILQSSELADIIDQRAEQRFIAMKLDQRLTRDQMAKIYQVTKETIDNVTDQEWLRLGWKKEYIKSLPRFKRIAEVEASKELFRKIRKGKI